MTPTVTALVLAAAFLHAVWNGLIKGGDDPLIGTTALSACWAVVGAALLPFVPVPAAAAWPQLAASVAVHVVYSAALALAYRSGDLSLVYPIARGLPPLLVAVAGVLLGWEALGPLAFAGVALVTVGVLSLANTGPRGWRSPALGRALLTAGLVAAYTALDGVGVRRSGTAVGYVVWLTAVQGWVFVGCVLVARGRGLFRDLVPELRLGVPAGLLAGGGYAIVLWCMTRAPIAAVAALRETAVLFGVAIAAVVLREGFGRRRLVAATLIAAGAALIQIGG